jgi:murein DD-endopeptidase MepM/ murein hydrolase activator NlpD
MTTDDRPQIAASAHKSAGLLVLIVALAACAPMPRPDSDLLPPVPAQTPEPADDFDFPLPRERFGPYLPYVGGPLPVDTRYAAQNPGVGADGKCFVDRSGNKVPFDQLYHAGEDWFARDARGRVDGHGAAGAPVLAVANGAVTWAQGIGADGYLIVLVHLLPDGSRVWSAYWHVARPVVPVGQAVKRGDRIADVFDRGFNSHLHWEIRTFEDGSSLFSRGSAGERGTCNGKTAAVGYTWDDDPSRARPDYWGYRDPTAFIAARRKSQ